jgi:UDP-N-acetylglucosamine acyltransferase
VVGARVWLQEGCEVSSFAVVGAEPQLKAKPLARSPHLSSEPSHSPSHSPYRLICLPRGRFRELCTVSLGAPHVGSGVTQVGSDCLIMSYSHIGHDCELGDGCILSNQVSLAGHVKVGDRVTFGGHAAVHQFVTIGDLVMVAAGALVSQDVPPYMLVAGDRAQLRGVNAVGLERAGADPRLTRQLRRLLVALRREGGGAPRWRELVAVMLGDLSENLDEAHLTSMEGEGSPSRTPSRAPSLSIGEAREALSVFFCGRQRGVVSVYKSLNDDNINENTP